MNLEIQTHLQQETIYPTLFYSALCKLVFDESGNMVNEIGKLFDLMPAIRQIRGGIEVSGINPWVKKYKNPLRHFKNQLKPKEVLCALKA